MTNNLITKEEFKDNPFVFVQLEELITQKQKIITQLELDIIICEEGRDKKYLEDQLTNTKNEKSQLVDNLINNSKYDNSAEQKYELLTTEYIKESLINNQKDLSLDYVKYCHFHLGISVDPKQTLVSEVHKNIPQYYIHQLEYLNNESYKENIKKYKDYLISIRKPFSKTIDDIKIERYLELITYIGGELSRLNSNVDYYQNRAK